MSNAAPKTLDKAVKGARVFRLTAISDRMPDFTTISPGERIKLQDDVVVEVVSVESSTSMIVRKLEPWERTADAPSQTRN